MKRPAVKEPSPDYTPLGTGTDDEDSEGGGAAGKHGETGRSSNSKQPKTKAKAKAKAKALAKTKSTPMKRRREEKRSCCQHCLNPRPVQDDDGEGSGVEEQLGNFWALLMLSMTVQSIFGGLQL